MASCRRGSGGLERDVDGNAGTAGKKITLPHYMVMFL